MRVDRWAAAAAAGDKKRHRMCLIPHWTNVLRSGVCTVIYAYDYLLMLVVMTFNAYLFFAVCLGLGFGVFCVGHRLQTKATDGKVHVEEFKTDPACCGA